MSVARNTTSKAYPNAWNRIYRKTFASGTVGTVLRKGNTASAFARLLQPLGLWSTLCSLFVCGLEVRAAVLENGHRELDAA